MKEPRQTDTTLKDGIYHNQTAIYLVKDGKVIMKLKGKAGWYKTNANFMLSAVFTDDLPSGTAKGFDTVYDKLKQW